MFCLTELIFLQPLHSQEFSVQQNCFAPCLCFLFYFLSLVISIATAAYVSNMAILQQWYPANNMHMHSQCCQKCLFPRNTLPEGALNDVPGRVNTADSEPFFLRWPWAPSKTNKSNHSRSTLAPLLMLFLVEGNDCSVWKKGRWDIGGKWSPGRDNFLSLIPRCSSLDQVLQSTIWHRSATDCVAHRCCLFPKITQWCTLRACCAPHPQSVLISPVAPLFT